MLLDMACLQTSVQFLLRTPRMFQLFIHCTGPMGVNQSAYIRLSVISFDRASAGGLTSTREDFFSGISMVVRTVLLSLNLEILSMQVFIPLHVVV